MNYVNNSVGWQETEGHTQGRAEIMPGPVISRVLGRGDLVCESKARGEFALPGSDMEAAHAPGPDSQAFHSDGHS